MATQRPISTISYNSENFLQEKLNNLYNAHIIQAWQYIKHKGEDGDKDHIHLRIEPNKRIDPMELTELFKEYVPGVEKPLGVRTWRNAKEEDWFLYAIHDEQYLKSKYNDNAKEKLPYKWQDVQVSEGYDLEVAFIRAKSTLERTSANITSRLRSGEKSLNLLQEGVNPILLNNVLRALSISDYERLARDYDELEKRYNRLFNAVKSSGLVYNDFLGTIDIGRENHDEL